MEGAGETGRAQPGSLVEGKEAEEGKTDTGCRGGKGRGHFYRSRCSHHP